MEIHDSRNKISPLRKIRKSLRSRKILRSIFIVLVIASFGFGCIIYGAYLNKTSQTSVLKMFVIRISEFDFSFIPKYAKSKTVDIDNLTLDINFKNWEKIRYLREKALYEGRITEITQSTVSASIRFQDQIYNVDIGLTGLTGEHIRHPDRWSLSVKVKGENTIKGMKKFALLVPQSRGYLTDWIATKLLVSQGIIGLKSDFVNVKINGQDHGIYYLEERYDKRLIEHNAFREGIIFQADDYGSDIEVYKQNQIAENPELKAQLERLRILWNAFLNEEIETSDIFDIKKFASIYAVSDLVNGKHALFFINMRLYFNPITGLIEPIGREWGYLRNDTYTEPNLTIGNPIYDGQTSIRDNVLLSKIFDSQYFKEQYIKQANVFSDPHYLDSIISSNSAELALLTARIHQHNPFYVFPIDLLKKNQKLIRAKLYPNLPPVEAYYKIIGDDSLTIFITNKSELPVELQSIIFNGEIEIVPEDRVILDANFERAKKYREIKLSLKKYILSPSFTSDSMAVKYNILGLSHIRKNSVFPKEIRKNSILDYSPTKKPSNIENFNFLRIDAEIKLISFDEKVCHIPEDMIIPAGYFVSAIPGCTINLTNSARIISYSPFLFFGRKDSIINITSSDSTGQGLIIYNCYQHSEFSKVSFSHLVNISDFGWDLTGAITFYESPVVINNCLFDGNLRGDDFLNIIRTNFHIQNTTFQNTVADALDTDFCSGTITNTKFINPGNDAIDVSGTKLNLDEVLIVNPGDKGISGGENSNIIGSNIHIIGGEIALACKDNSRFDIDRITIDSTKIGYTAFQKKPEFGGGIINVNNSISTGVELKYLIEKNSSLNINGNSIIGKSDSVEAMLYGVEYGKSSE